MNCLIRGESTLLRIQFVRQPAVRTFLSGATGRVQQCPTTFKQIPCMFNYLRQRLTTNWLSSRLPPQLNRNAKSYCTRPFDVNTNVAKDVILYKYENSKFFTMVNIFAICQFVFWNYLSHFSFTTLRDAPVEKVDADTPWYQRINLGENKYRNGITIFCFLVGYGILATAWLYTLRSVRFLILRKGGQEVSFVTYGPFNKNRIMNVPLKCVSAQESRQVAKVQLPIKVKNKALFYILDMRGDFLNPRLFDYTVGLRRKL